MARQAAIDDEVARQQSLADQLADVSSRLTKVELEKSELEAARETQEQIKAESELCKRQTQASLEQTMKAAAAVETDHAELLAKFDDAMVDLDVMNKYTEGQDDLVESMVAHHDDELHSLRVAAIERAESMANAAREAEDERRELQGMLDAFQPKLKAEEEKYEAMCAELASYLGAKGERGDGTTLQGILQSVKDKNAADLLPYNSKVKSLRLQLEECLTSHALKKRTIEENHMVLEHLQTQIDDMLDLQLMRKIREEEKAEGLEASTPPKASKTYTRFLPSTPKHVGAELAGK